MGINHQWANAKEGRRETVRVWKDGWFADGYRTRAGFKTLSSVVFFTIQSRTFTVKYSEDAIKRPSGVDLWAEQEWNKRVKICSEQRRTICKGVKEKRPPQVPKIKCPAACQAPWFTFWSNRCKSDVLAIVLKLKNVKYSHYMLTWMTNAGSKRIKKEKDVRNGGFTGSGGTKSMLRISPINFKRSSCCVTSVSCSSWWLCSLKRCVESAAHLTQHGRQTEIGKKLVK